MPATPSATPPIHLYDLTLSNGCPASPYVWRIKFALAHKGLPFTPIPTGFLGIRQILDGTHTKVPVINDNGTVTPDSWAIADYLDRTYPAPAHALLFNTKAERTAARFLDAWLFREVFRGMFRCYVLDIHNAAHPDDRAYFRESRERMLGGKTLEETVEGREDRLPVVRKSLQPLRDALAETPWLGGDQPGYTDYCALGWFIWIASVNTHPPLESTDPLVDWLTRGLDLYGGLARDPRMNPLAA